MEEKVDESTQSHKKQRSYTETLNNDCDFSILEFTDEEDSTTVCPRILTSARLPPHLEECKLTYQPLSQHHARLLPLIQVIRGERGYFKRRTPQFLEVFYKVLKAEPLFLSQFGLSTFVEFVPFAQQSLDLLLGLSPNGYDVTITFGNYEMPWLCQYRQVTATYEQQISELTVPSEQ